MMQETLLARIVAEGSVHRGSDAYFEGRGFSEKLTGALSLGILPDGLRPFAAEIDEDPCVLACYRYVIPEFRADGGISYLIVRIDASLARSQMPFRLRPVYKLGASKGALWHVCDLFRTDAPMVFICENWSDACSILEAGGAAVALNAIDHILTLWKLLKRMPRITSRTYVLACDNDAYGVIGNENLQKMFDDLGLPARSFGPFPKGVKDCNAWLTTDRDAFVQHVHSFLTRGNPWYPLKN